MRIAYLDCFSGISGDMMLGALLHAGVDVALFRKTVAGLGLEAQIKVEEVNRSGISSTRVRVLTAENERDDVHVVLHEHSHNHSHEHGHDSHHSHSHSHSHGHEHSHGAAHSAASEEPKHSHDHGHNHDHKHAHGRSLREIHDLISGAAIDSASRAIALRAFQLLGEAEAKIHNIPVERIHFHEVGAVDAIVDIVGSAVGCVSLGIDRWLCSPLNVGGGTVQCAHGVFPVPAPATLELLKGCPVYNSGVQAELVTPTGAAILRALNAEFCSMPPITVDRTGYGAGARDLPGLANVVRITIGESASKEKKADSGLVTVIETAVDDLTPQLVAYVMEQLLATGAFDVMVTPVQMKKNRPGHLFTVLCEEERKNALCDLLLRESTTLGLRVREEKRQCIQRKFTTVSTRWGEVHVKLGYLNGELVNCAPEFEDCRRIAEQNKVPLKIVMQEATRLYRAEHAGAAD